ncbi:hypothetical protein [Hymenobacter cheonanensis]|uniref:hypothetical protein n=1 Tax=Hymenobacter sp. CA2-7 TaxID=3063993 RepID=UPI002712BCAA|nr:hypothetical protein [Hymenobacter sp. CA2-7]MDO7884958.1 hypothetical protein [Hymenobacter sp. CA2-7]
MFRRFLLPLLGVAIFATEAASAQTVPAAKPVAGAYSHPIARPKALTARERRAAEAAAKAEAAAAKAAAVAPAQPDATASTSWNGWSNEPLPQADNGAPHRPTMNVSVAPGMPLNQVGHGVTTDYNGRPLRHEVASTSLSTSR